MPIEPDLAGYGKSSLVKRGTYSDPNPPAASRKPNWEDPHTANYLCPSAPLKLPGQQRRKIELRGMDRGGADHDDLSQMLTIAQVLEAWGNSWAGSWCFPQPVLLATTALQRSHNCHQLPVLCLLSLPKPSWLLELSAICSNLSFTYRSTPPKPSLLVV